MTEDKKILNNEELEKVTGGAAKVVAADDAAATTKTVEGGTVEIYKNGKKFSAPGAKMK